MCAGLKGMASHGVRALAALTCLFYVHLTQGQPRTTWNEVKCYQNRNPFAPQQNSVTQSYRFEPKHPGSYTFKLTVQDFCDVRSSHLSVCLGRQYSSTDCSGRHTQRPSLWWLVAMAPSHLSISRNRPQTSSTRRICLWCLSFFLRAHRLRSRRLPVRLRRCARQMTYGMRLPRNTLAGTGV